MTVSSSLPGVATEFGFLLRATLLMGAAWMSAAALRRLARLPPRAIWRGCSA